MHPLQRGTKPLAAERRKVPCLVAGGGGGLVAAIGTYDHTKLLKSKAVTVAGFEMHFAEVEPIIAAFRRMVRHLEYDVCELAPTTYSAAREAGLPITALPIFLMRRFHHGDIVCRRGSGIVEPRDLEGRRVGVRAYSVSTGVWARGILQHEYGVDLGAITWVVDDEDHVRGYEPPSNVVKTTGQSIASLFHEGGIDAALTRPAGIGRSGAPASGWAIAGRGFDDADEQSDYYRLFPQAENLEADWFRRCGIYPIHGLIVVKDEVLARHPACLQPVRCIHNGEGRVLGLDGARGGALRGRVQVPVAAENRGR